MSDPLELSKLDAWIAEHVMGWSLAKRFDGDELIQRTLKEKKSGLPEWMNEFKPTTDPAAAMLVFEKLAVGSPFTHMTKLGEKWVIFKGPDSEFSNRVEADSLPLAICMLAKKLFQI